MAIARGAGTEIIRSASFEDVDDNVQILIEGVQHHIYTVLSVICYVNTMSSPRYLRMRLKGYDSNAGTTAQEHIIFKQVLSVDETFVWNDKFSFNGFEPVDFAGPMDDATKQDAIADQGSGVGQYLEIHGENSADRFDIVVTFIDQNNA